MVYQLAESMQAHLLYIESIGFTGWQHAMRDAWQNYHRYQYPAGVLSRL
jgi:hypothetical protein